MKKFRAVLCTLFAAAIVAGASAVSAFAELYIRTEAASGEINKEAEAAWKENKLIMQFGMDDKNKAKALKFENGFLVKGLGKSSDSYIYPVTCDGEVIAMADISKKENGGYAHGFYNFDIGVNDLVTSAGSPADIYYVDEMFFAVIDGEYFTLRDYTVGWNKKSSSEINAASKKIKEYRNENPSNGKYINAYCFSQNGWRTVGGRKYFIKKSGVLANGWLTIGGSKYYFDKNSAAVTKDTTIKSKRYRFDSDGKYLGTYTGFLKSGEKQYYYKKGVKQTGDFTVDGKTYHADKNGVISKK